MFLEGASKKSMRTSLSKERKAAANLLLRGLWTQNYLGNSIKQ